MYPFTHWIEWAEYVARLPTGLYGEVYGFNVDKIPKANLKDLWEDVRGWYTRDMDVDWSEWSSITSPCVYSSYPLT